MERSGGSSPRWRGTPTAHQRGFHLRRIIPALAGNTRRWRRRLYRPPDHPRAGGEHCACAARALRSSAGSSPRWRGTRLLAPALLLRRRIIPALAGNTPEGQWKSLAKKDHPRAGGEHGISASNNYKVTGSSPRWRGTRSRQDCDMRRRRIIPALAGNTSNRRVMVTGVTDHPRAGGEHGLQVSRSTWGPGSSPRWRGTPASASGTYNPVRIIPALAGNTPHPSQCCGLSADHPRAGGEHRSCAGEHSARGGSSPRWRGTHEQKLADHDKNRIIPALAGNTSSR